MEIRKFSRNLLWITLFILVTEIRMGRSQCANSNDFPCRSNNQTCVPRVKWQDGQVDCADGSDEECLEWQYDCKFGKPKCVSLYNFMDGVIDCASGFDEACPAHYFVCMDRSDCIDPKRYLDGRKDCADGSDEPCPAAHFLCHDRSRCVEMNKFQDGHADCPDSSDEECTLFQIECLCGTPRCVDIRRFNDSFSDCEDGSDEPSLKTLSNNLADYKCPDGQLARNVSDHAATPPPGAPMVPCGPTDLNLCSEELNEMCLIIAGAARCVCQMGSIRPPGSAKCIPAPTRQPTVRPSRPPLILPNHDNTSTAVLPVLKEVANKSQDSCSVDDAHSCPGSNEICTKTQNLFACVCENGFARNPTSGRCSKMVDECSDEKLNDCDKNAICMDNPISYECLCKEGYLDMSVVPQTTPGRHCVPLVNECNDTRTNECDKNADCLDLPGGYTCRCKQNFRDVSPNANRAPGRKCVTDRNECLNKTDNDCSPFATCSDLTDGYQCRCKDGFVDVSPNKAGRDCKQIINECLNETGNDCDKANGECIDTLDGFVCRCKPGFVDAQPSKPGRQCTNSNNPCLDPTLNDCDPNALCNSAGPTLFECSCPSGFVDVSPDVRRPGRLCRQSVDECALGTHRCDPNAICTDTPDAYTCKCPDGWRDVSKDRVNPGRNCEKPDNECKDVSKNDCSPNAQCHNTDEGFNCQCNDGYFDASSKTQKQPGRVCEALKNECKEKNECSSDSDCIDTPDSYLCRCKEGFKDDSPDPINRPGRKCSKTTGQPLRAECNVDDPLTCKKDLLEVCTFENNTYKCVCPKGVSRLPDGKCKVINECLEERLNDCHKDAQCFDTSDSYNCQCKSGFADLSEDKAKKPGRVCKELINECSDPQKFKVDCNANAICVDTESSFTCRCGTGFADVSDRYSQLPGRRCVKAINECLNATLNECSTNALCEDSKESYTCRCKEGFIDASPNVTHYPGRVCNKPINTDNNSTVTNAPFVIEPCDPNAPNPCRGRGEACVSDGEKFICQCSQAASRFEDGTCKVFKACDNPQSNDCDKNAICSNVFDSYTCQCKPEFLDISPDPNKKPGRKCKELINECADPSMNDCSVFATCIDTREAFACVCRNKYVDVSAQFNMPPGRKCQNTSNECSVRTLNTCDENADCVDTAEGYTCQCAPGFVDVSSAADLPPGRSCTVQTSCPKQQTDLIFLVDGSGSIGSFVFKAEVLRFVREFVTLFDVGSNSTRIGMIQFSDQIRHEFELGQYQTKADVEKAVTDVAYLTGLTRTGAAISDMVNFGFSEKRGARPMSSGVHRVAIVITDGRSQDNVTVPSLDARRANVLIFAVGVTDHVLESELMQISGSRERTFVVEQFTDLNTRLRSLIQKAACPPVLLQPPTKSPGCDPKDQNACDRTRNEICVAINGAFACGCPESFERHPLTGVCGGELCNFQLRTSCPDPDICKKTPFGTFRCVCPAGYFRLPPTGVCFSSIGTQPPVTPSPQITCKVDDASSCGKNEVCVKTGDRAECKCQAGLVRQPITNACAVPGSCDPRNPTTCDSRRREQCLQDGLNNFICQCPPKFDRNPVTQICLHDECATGTHDCDKKAICTDTAEGFICQCPDGYLDDSKDPQKPGRVCRLVAFVTDLCEQGKHNCSTNAICIPITGGFTCQCKANYVDFSPNPQQFGGIVCKEKENECTNGKATCHKNATCIDTDESYICVCRPGFMDKLGLTNPGRQCEPFNVNNRCEKGNNDCDPNARCIPQGASDFICVCPGGYKDKSPNVQSRPGRLCIPLIPECDNPSLNDCDANANCFEQEEGFTCACKAEFVDISHDPQKPGRLCKKLIDECFNNLDDCANDNDGGICEDTADSYACRCRPGFTDLSPDPVNRPGRVCRPIRNKCAEGLHDCSPHANCVETGSSFTCLCSPGFYDVSTDPVNRPGRSCLRLINECENATLNDCSVNAFCNDTIQSYRCQCKGSFIDESPDQLNRPGRLCRPRQVNECAENLADCSVNAECIDLDDGFSCQCHQGFIDESPKRITLPGRVCVPMPPTTPKPECRIENINSCNVNLNEVCRIVNNQPKCVCPERFDRHQQTNACTVINECKYFDLNDCSPNADCVDEVDGYTCKCRTNFRDTSPNPGRPGRVCQPNVNECQFPHLNDCHLSATCTDLESSFTCKCKDGFIDMSPDPVNRPGRICHQNRNECLDPNLNTCDQNAKCIDEPFGYRCECKEGFLDISPTPTITGRACKRIVNECLNKKDNDCDPTALCTDTRDSYRCECPANSTDISPNPAFPGRVCHIDVDACRQNLNDCDKNAICRNTGTSFTCECAANFIDRSPNPLRPGRICLPLVNECTDGSATCSPNANCRDLEDGYTCECKQGFVDRSPVRSQPGRICTRPEICPSNHDCSAAAVCEPNENGGFTCRCIPGYEDESPNDKPGRVCIRGDKCRDARLNNCSRNAICFPLNQGYRCECVQGFVDKSPDPTLPGRVCETATPPPPPKKHPCQDPALNDCSLSGVCRSINDTSYTCECRQGFVDRSPDPINKPGRVCVPQPPVCFDSTQNDCHPFAICEQVNDARRFTCRCRDGYVDTSPDQSKPGRICREKINECLDASKNDCAPQAICEDLDLGFNCRCPPKFKDTSPDTNRPGRQCFALVNECLNPQLNNCSRFADCFDQEIDYRCQCKEGYFDNDQTVPGRQCAFIINECEVPNLNDCDKHANCTDLPGGYSCKCPAPYVDKSPDVRFPGRICLLNECELPNLNDCHKDSVCQDTPDSFVCHCKEGFVDVSNDPRKPGRNCQKIATTNAPITTTTPNPDAIPCGQSRVCLISLNERCVGGIRCECPPGTNRRASGLPCVQVTGIPLPLRVIRRNENTLFWASAFGNPNDPRYIEITDMFNFGIARALNSTPMAQFFVTASTDAITHPRLYNASWNNGLMFNFTVYVTPNSVQPKLLWQELLQSIFKTNYSIGGTELFIDIFQIDPFVQPPPPGPSCGDRTCDPALGEVCIGGRICACPRGKGRREPNQPCVDVVGFTLPLWVFRRNEVPFHYNNSFIDTNSEFYKQLVDTFVKGCQQAYSKTGVWSGYIFNEVRDILDPQKFNASWDQGCMFNFTVYFEKGYSTDARRCWNELIQSCKGTNFSLGGTELFINPLQPDPFSICFKNDCHPKATCIERSSNSYTCKCPDKYRDLDATRPGRRCIAEDEFDECANPADNECSPNADCIDEPHLYRCECKKSYVDLSPSDGPKGRICEPDYCLDVPFCPSNTSCANVPEIQGARCQCHDGFIDIKPSPKRLKVFGENIFCLANKDVNECELEITNCSSIATCVDLNDGYTCSCPAGYTDAQPSIPGRVCAGASCGLCNGKGDCVPQTGTRDVKCRCHSWYTGEFCDKDMRIILVIIFAVIFLLLTLCCLLYFCLKCRCVKGRGLWYREPLFTYRKGHWPWSTLEASSSSESGGEFHSGMSTSALGKGSDYYPDLAIPRAKLKQGEQQSSSSQTRRFEQQQKLASYLDNDSHDSAAIKIPRAKLSAGGGASTVERDGSDSVVFSDVHHAMVAGTSMKTRDTRYSDSESENSSSISSDYTLREEIERRVITDVKRTETSKTITAEIHKDATAEFHVYPPVEGAGNRTVRSFSDAIRKLTFGGKKQQSTRKQVAMDEQSTRMSSSSNVEHLRDSKEIYESSRFPGAASNHSERDRGQSVAEVSVAGMQGRGSEWGIETATTFSQPRAMSEYTERDLESISEESQLSTSTDDAQQELYDKKVLVKKSHDFQPSQTGRGGTERFKSEVNTKVMKSETKKY